MPEFTAEFKTYMEEVDAGKRAPFPRPRTMYEPSPEKKQMRDKAKKRNRAARTWRAAQEKARREAGECQMPLCSQPAIQADGGSLGICLPCSFPVIDYWDSLKGTIEADQAREGLRERRVTQQLHEIYLGEKERESRRNRPGWIYYVLIDGRIKIGYSVDVKKRLTAYPFDSPLLAMHPGTKQLEAEMHKKFAGSRAAGREWFLDTDELRSHINEVIDQFGEPDRARYERRGRRRSNMRAAAPKPTGISR